MTDVTPAQPAPGSLRADLEATVKTWREESEPYPAGDLADNARRSSFGYCADELAKILASHTQAAQPAPELGASTDPDCPVCANVGGQHGVPSAAPELAVTVAARGGAKPAPELAQPGQPPETEYAPRLSALLEDWAATVSELEVLPDAGPRINAELATLRTVIDQVRRAVAVPDRGRDISGEAVVRWREGEGMPS